MTIFHLSNNSNDHVIIVNDEQLSWLREGIDTEYENLKVRLKDDLDFDDVNEFTKNLNFLKQLLQGLKGLI